MIIYVEAVLKSCEWDIDDEQNNEWVASDVWADDGEESRHLAVWQTCSFMFVERVDP